VPELAAPSARYRDSFIAALDEFAPDEDAVGFERQLAASDFDAYLRRCAAWSRGKELPDGWSPSWIPMSVFWLVDGKDYIGTVNVRHTIADIAQDSGGHVGYAIRSSQRRKGYGRMICRLALDEARKLGLDRVLLTCADDNVGSVNIIERNGGVLEDKIMVEGRSALTRRYWIEL
jgi:predicted acetyltransferase